MAKHQIIIIGSGFGGQTTAINLLKQNITDFIILERRSFMGGTWCQNTYPGAAVDVPSPLYSISSEPYSWSQMYAKGDEIRDYTRSVIEKYQLNEKTKMNTNVVQATWSESKNRWVIETDQHTYEAQFIVNATGPLSNPVVPDFIGKDSFEGESFHTNKWNHDFDYKDKKVAIIGSGASAAQIIPELAKDTKHLYVFQRSPHWVLPRGDYEFKDWQRKLLQKPVIRMLFRNLIYWQLETRIIGFKYSHILLNLIAKTHAKLTLKKTVKNDELRKKLTPNYMIGCKRIILSNTLYPSLSQNNVTLLDNSQSIKKITPIGIVTSDEQSLDLDLIVYSTGYDASDGLISYPVTGKNGAKLQNYWDDYPRAYLGTVVPSIPNFFIVTGPNTGIGHTSAIFVIEAQMHYIMKAIKHTLDLGHQTIDVKASAEEEYTSMIHKQMTNTVWEKGGCNSWYQSKSGKITGVFPGFTFSYLRLTKAFKPSHHNFS